MGLDSKTIKHIASLARLSLTEREEEKMKTELSSILGYVEQLNQVKTEGVEPLYQTTGLVNSVREDEHLKDFKMDEQLNERLIGQAPDKQERFIRVKTKFGKINSWFN